MIFRALDELIFSFPAVFWCQLNPSDAAKLLARATERGAPPDERVDGEIVGTNVMLHRHRSIARNPFSPIFDGNLRASRNGSQLVGEFRRRKIVLLFCGVAYLILLPGIPFVLAAAPLMSIWLGAPVLLGVVAGVFSALALVGALFTVAAVMRIGMYAASGDANWISEHIDHVFRRGSV